MPDLHEPTPPEHPSVAEVERILATAAARSTLATRVRHGEAVVERAVWLCPCVTFDKTPVWLIYDDPDGELAWSRVPTVLR